MGYLSRNNYPVKLRDAKTTNQLPIGNKKGLSKNFKFPLGRVLGIIGQLVLEDLNSMNSKMAGVDVDVTINLEGELNVTRAALTFEDQDGHEIHIPLKINFERNNGVITYKGSAVEVEDLIGYFERVRNSIANTIQNYMGEHVFRTIDGKYYTSTGKEVSIGEYIEYWYKINALNKAERKAAAESDGGKNITPNTLGPFTTSIEYINYDFKIDHEDSVHGNSITSQKPQHGYKIVDENGNVSEFGISGQELNKDESSPRVKQKLRTKYNNDPNYTGEVVEKDLKNRKEAIEWEKKQVKDYKKNNGGAKPPYQIRP
jgi:hypothetical protein